MNRWLVASVLFTGLWTVYTYDVPVVFIGLIFFLASFYDLISVDQQILERVSNNQSSYCQITNHQSIYRFLLLIYTMVGWYNLLVKYNLDKVDWCQRILVISLCDGIQYVTGKYFGSHRISSISPNKTLEGYIGGVGVTFLLFIPLINWYYLLQNIVAGIIGDLYISFIKRQLEIKDTSDLLGEHGGWLDRFDGIYASFILI